MFNNESTKPKIKIFITLLAIMVFLPNLVFASIFNGTIDSNYKYAWSTEAGWINFGCSHCQVQISDSKITGYAWSENYGWINLSPSKSGIKNTPEGYLSGYAWSKNLGWINFNRVSIDENGRFSGYATIKIDNSKINFDCPSCKVETDWRPARVRPTAMPSAWLSQPQAPKAGFKISINNDAEYTNNPTKVILNLFGGADAKKMVIANNPDFSGIDSTSQIPYASFYQWNLCQGQENICEKLRVGELTSYEFKVYAKFYNSWGRSSGVTSDSIIYKKKIVKKIVTPEKIVKTTKSSSKPFIKKISKFLKSLIPEFLKPKPSKKIHKEIPVENPISMSLPLQGKWKLLSYTKLNLPFPKFTLAPLPKEYQELAKKFPDLKKTFTKIGIQKLVDVEKLKNVKLTLPGLTERVTSKKISLNKILLQKKDILLKALPLAKLSPEMKRKLPTGIIFAKTSRGLIDFNATLVVNDKNRPQQKISTIPGKPLQLIIKPDKPVKSVTGYVVWRSKGISQKNNNKFLASNQIPNPNDKITKNLSIGYLLGQLETKSIKNFKLSWNLLLSSMTGGVNLGENNKPVKVEEKLVLQKFEYADPDKDGIYTAEIQSPRVAGKYDIVTVIDFRDPKLGRKEILLTTVVDPEGYVYEKIGNKEARISGAKVSLYWLDPTSGKYELWPAQNYQQENPQITNITGKYSFLVPAGKYYLKANASDYLPYKGVPFQVESGRGIHLNVELKTKYWWLKFVNWNEILFVVIILLLMYNFYEDRKRKRGE